MKIAPGVSWHPFGDKVYVHNVDTRRDHILEGIAFDVLNFFDEHPHTSAEAAATEIAEQFDDEDFNTIRNDIGDFIEDLLAEEILVEPAQILGDKKIVREVESFYANNHKLFSLSLELTWRCAEKCIHCYIDDAEKFCAKDELTLDEYKNILRQARQLYAIRVLLTGGEVLLRPDLCDIAEYAVKLGFIVDIYTTGLGLTDEVFERLCAIKLNSVSFSLYAGDAELHDRITSVNGSFEKTLKAMLMFRSAGINTFIKSVIIRQNFHGLKSLYELGRRLNIDVNVSPKIFSGHEHKCANDYRLSDDDLYKKFFELDWFHKKNSSRKFAEKNFIALSEGTLCFAGKNTLSLDPFGNARPCVGFKKSVGSVRKDTLENIWRIIGELKYLKNLKLKTLTPKCQTCQYIRFCHVCIAELFDEDTKTFRECTDEFIMAKAATEFMTQKGGKLQ